MIVRYLLEKCKNVSEAVSYLYQLPSASAQTLTLADTRGAIAVIECNAEKIKVEKMKKAVNIDYAPVTLDKSDKKVGLSFL